MKKKIAIIVSCVLAVLVVLAGVLTYLAFNPKTTISIAHTPKTSDKYYEFITMSWQNILPVTKSWNENFDKYHKWNEDVMNDLSNNYVSPTDVKANVEIKDGKTIITYSGKATGKESGITTDYKKELILDYAFSRNIEINRVP
ncbi:MAG: hypothetical protein RR229_07355 [Oscillospiraceae bacterium]